MAPSLLLGKLHYFLARHPLAVNVAVKVRNQVDSVIAKYLGESPNSDKNGEDLLMRQMAPTARTVFDVGANLGHWTTTFLASAPAEARVYLYEPSPVTYAKLLANLGSSGERAVAHNAGMGASLGKLPFYESAKSSELSSFVASEVGPDAICREVDILTVDDECRRLGLDRLDLLKVDTEGYDLHVLRGAAGMLSRQAVGVVQFEYNSFWSGAGSTLSTALGLFAEHGYDVYLLRSPGLFSFNYAKWGEFYAYSNFVAVSPSMRDKLAPLVKGRV